MKPPAVRLIAAAAVLEGLTGLGLILLPAAIVHLLIGGSLAGSGVALGRVAGIGLLSLALACWPRAEPTRPALRALFVYNLLVASYLAWLLVRGRASGVLLLPALGLHALLSLLLAWAWFRHRSTQGSKA